MVNALIGAFGGSSSTALDPVHGFTVGQRNVTTFTTAGYPNISNLKSSDPNTNAGRPKAYLNWILFDEQFNMVASSSGTRQVNMNADTKATMTYTGNVMGTNGYLYVYLSNESPMDVFFDNLQSLPRQRRGYTQRGTILEETHYYPFGLTMAGISSKAVGKLENRFKFNDGTELESKEFSDGSGLELYATEFRSYDPQIGRFHQLDPLGELSEDIGLYTFALNNPLLFNDPLGLDTLRRNKDGTLPTVRPDGSELQDDDVVLDENGGVANYYNGESWQAPKNLDEIVVTPNSASENDVQEAPWMEQIIIDVKSIKGIKENLNPTFGIANGALKYTGLSDPTAYAWCSAYACFKLHNSGFSEPHTAKSRYWTNSSSVTRTGTYYGAIAVFRNYADKNLKKKLSSGHIGFLYGLTSDGKYIILGGNQGNTLKFGTFSTTSGYIRAIGGYMHLEGFYFPANYSGPKQIAPTYQSSAKLNALFGILSSSNTTR